MVRSRWKERQRESDARIVAEVARREGVSVSDLTNAPLNFGPGNEHNREYQREHTPDPDVGIGREGCRDLCIGVVICWGIAIFVAWLLFN